MWTAGRPILTAVLLVVLVALAGFAVSQAASEPRTSSVVSSSGTFVPRSLGPAAITAFRSSAEGATAWYSDGVYFAKVTVALGPDGRPSYGLSDSDATSDVAKDAATAISVATREAKLGSWDGEAVLTAEEAGELVGPPVPYSGGAPLDPAKTSLVLPSRDDGNRLRMYTGLWAGIEPWLCVEGSGAPTTTICSSLLSSADRSPLRAWQLVASGSRPGKSASVVITAPDADSLSVLSGSSTAEAIPITDDRRVGARVWLLENLDGVPQGVSVARVVSADGLTTEIEVGP